MKIKILPALAVLIGLFQIHSVTAAPITNGLVAHLKFDGNYSDATTNGVDGTPVGTPTFEAGILGQAIHIISTKDDVTNNYVTLGYPTVLKFGSQPTGDATDFSVAFWTKIFSQSDDKPWISNKDWNAGGNLGWVINTQGDGMKWNYRDDGGSARRDSPHVAPQLNDHNWHHVVVTFERTNVAKIYIDGALIDTTSIAPGLDSSTGNLFPVGSLDTDDLGFSVNLGQDGTGEYTDGGAAGVDMLMDDVGIWRRLLGGSEVFRIYNAGLSNLDLARVPDVTTPFVASVTPGAGSTAAEPAQAIRITIQNGSTQLDTNSVQLFLDNTKVTPTLVSGGDTNSITYQRTNVFAPLSTHTFTLIFSDNGSPVFRQTNSYQFTVVNYTNILLPAPLFFESFDEVAEGSLPTGWTVQNFTADQTAGADLNNPLSDSFKDWVVISRQRVLDIGAAGNWDAARRLNVAPGQVVNSQPVTSLVNGNFIYAESDQRGGSQVQYLFSPDFNLAGKTNIFASYHSIYEQNQDSIGSVEYSIDGGTTWLPIVYMIDRDDIIRDAGGNIDAEATLNEPRGDTATYTDPVTGEARGGTYGAFIGAAITADLAPFISGRVNDGPVESKRVEYFRLPQADNQTRVRFRFAQAGTASWYFGVDDFGVYSIVPVATKPAAPAVTGASSVSFFGKQAKFTGSPFAGIHPGDVLASTLWQISSSSDFSAPNGLAKPFLTITVAGNSTSLETNLLERVFPGVTYYVSAQYSDQNGLKSDFGTPFSFTVEALPTPIVLETFEATPDLGVPAGWTRSNQTDTATAGLNAADPNSDVYKDWTVVPFATLEAFGGGRADTNVVSGKSVYAESDNRSGNQIQSLLTPVFDLRGKNSVWVAFRSNYVQNQDSIGVLEYTIDGGQTWLPVVYLINDKPSNSDIVRTNGVIDATATLTTTASDIAKMIDPATGQRVAAGKYADFILARPIGSLGPYLSGRIDDDKTESKRYERFSIPAADNQAAVQFRFLQAGTGSWWWGLDDFGLYSIASKPAAPAVTGSSSVSFFGKQATFTGSAFSGIHPGDVLASTVWQISASSTFAASNGLANPLMTFTISGNSTSLQTNLLERLFPGATYYVSAQYVDQNGLKSDFGAPFSFTVEPLPTPVVLETFDATPDLGVPAGWSRSNQTDTATAGLNAADPNSDVYKDWTVVPFATLQAFGGGRADTNVVSGKSVYAESDNRSGNQIQSLLTPVFDLRGKNNVWVAFRSNYVQNQDSIGVLEYTIDGGQTWLPVVYLINDKPSNSDIVRTNGVIDATATLTTTASDIAKMIDPATGQRVAAGKYADFILARPIGSLGPYLSGRIDDDKTESKRYERFNIPAADNQAAVQFRFLQAGTGSWWWGLDDFGLYSVGGAPELRFTAIGRNGNNLTFTIPSDPQVKLQKKAALSDATWQDVSLAPGQTVVNVPMTDQTAFYRLAKP